MGESFYCRTLEPYVNVFMRPVRATEMLWKHRRSIGYELKQAEFKRAYNQAFTTYFIRGEDCGKGCLDPLWILAPWSVPAFWDLEMEITTYCGNNCIHCEQPRFPKEYRQNISFDQFKNIIDSVPRLKWINVTGEGSPYLNPAFPDMIQYAKAKGIYVDFSHDFMRFDSTTAQHLINYGIDRVYFSIDGATKQTYESVRLNCNFERVIENIKLLVQFKKAMKSPLPEICFRFAFMKPNVHEVPALLDLIYNEIAEKDIKLLGDEPSVNFVGLLEFPETKHLVCEIPVELYNEANQKAKEYGLTLYWSHPSHNEATKPALRWCMFWTEPYIMITGHVVPCCAVLMSNKRSDLEAQSFGNVNDTPITELWKNEKYKRFRYSIGNPKAPVPSICLGCRVFATYDRAKKYGIWDMRK